MRGPPNTKSTCTRSGTPSRGRGTAIPRYTCGSMTPDFPPIPPSMEAVRLTLLIAAAVFDVRYRRIPNWLTVSGVLVGVALNAAIGLPEAGTAFALEGLALGFGVYFLLYVLHAMGAGDVKLMAAV